jgi:hypothetical protein
MLVFEYARLARPCPQFPRSKTNNFCLYKPLLSLPEERRPSVETLQMYEVSLSPAQRKGQDRLRENYVVGKG